MSEHVHDGQVTVAGQTGSLLTALSRMLCLAECWTHLTGGTVWSDASTEARTEGGTAFAGLSAVADEVYAGMDVKFTALRSKLTVLGVLGGSSVINWEYWNGTSWVALTVGESVAGAKNFTANGEITWAAPADWAKNTVNGGPSLYHVRARLSGQAMTTQPTHEFLVHNWTIFDDAAGTNVKVYKSIGEDGTSTILLYVDDNGTMYTNAQQAAFRIYETWDNVAHTGTNPAPTVAQVANGLSIRKSVTLDATARTVWAAVSRDRIIVCILTGDTAGQIVGFYAGKFTSYVAGDGWNQVAIGGAVSTFDTNLFQFDVVTAITQKHYLQRAYTGTGGSTLTGGIQYGGTAMANFAYPNGPDGAVTMIPKQLFEGTSPNMQIRGELMGVYCGPLTTAAAIVNGDTFTYNGNRYTALRCKDAGGSGVVPWIFLRGAA